MPFSPTGGVPADQLDAPSCRSQDATELLHEDLVLVRKNILVLCASHKQLEALTRSFLWTEISFKSFYSHFVGL